MANKKSFISFVIFFIILFLLATHIYLAKKRALLYLYDVKSDYNYTFHQTDANIIKLTLNKEKVTLPKLDNIDQTAFLKVNIDSTFSGKYLQPYINIKTKKSSITQYFEHEVSGNRYLNISELLNKEELELKFEGKHVSIKDQTIQLILFKNQDIDKDIILVLAPHPDDAEIAAYGLYSSSRNSFIVTVTAGEAGGNKYDEVYQDIVKQYLKKGELRTWSSITVPLLGGVPLEQSVNLGFFDERLETMYLDKTSIVRGLYTNISDIDTFRRQNISSLSYGLKGNSDWNSLVKNLEYLLKEIEPDIIVTPYPALDSHKDHKFTSIALFEAIKNLNITEGKLYLYTNHFVLSEAYPYGKTGGVISLPANFDNNIYFDSIYSHTLSTDKQKDKIFALEAMHDLRLDTEWRSYTGAIKLPIFKVIKDIRGINDSYYRRSVRSNELFFITDIINIYDIDTSNKITGEF